VRQLKPIKVAKQFYSILKELITSGDYNEGDKLPSIRDFAKEYNISKTTVSSAISILENEGILEVIQGKGIFIRDINKANKLIGVMLYNFEEESKVEASILKSIQQNFSDGYFLSMKDSANNMDTICMNTQVFINAGVQGLIILLPKCPEATSEQAAELKKIIGPNIPVVFLLRDIYLKNSDFVTVDFGEGIYNNVDKNLKAGRNKILLITHDYIGFAESEIESYKKAFSDNNEKYEDRYLQNGSNLDTIGSSIKNLINEIDVLIASDQTLFELVDIISSRDKSKPSLHIIGYNSDSYAKYYDLQTSAIEFPSEKVGHAVAKFMIERIESNNNIEGRRKKTFYAL
jgi:GntR family transcriptional regulator